MKEGLKAEIVRAGILDMSVCVPKDWTDSQVLMFSESHNPCGTRNGWEIRREGSKWLNGCPERIPCNDKEGYIHIVLDA